MIPDPSRHPPPLDPILAGRCAGCRMPEGWCFCADIPAVPTRTRIVLVRHCAEIAKTSNTGRIAARALTNCTMVDHGLQGPPLDLSDLVEPDARVLYPGAPPSDGPLVVPTLVVLDGSWSHARGMRQRVRPLTELRSLSLPAPVVAPLRMRRGNYPEQLATIEAIAAALDVLGEPEPADRLRGIFSVMATRMRDLRGFDMPPKR